MQELLGCFLKTSTEGKTASPGWYNSAAFEQEAHAAGLYAKVSTEMPFSNEVKQQTINLIKADLGKWT
jgi:enoyl-[acyl-carrier protein] reductase/trans-2-enoyl-CoA reductase (NAD+)